MTKTNIDDIDLKILSALRDDARISNLELAEKVGLSPTPCSRRVRALEMSGVIKGYHTQIDLTAVASVINVLINVRLSHQAPENIDEFMSAVHRLPEITECLLVTGNLDYVLKVQTSDVQALRDFVLKELKTIPCVSDTSTMLILDEAKSTT